MVLKMALIAQFLSGTSSPVLALSADFQICKGNHRITCIVDGDTLWFQQVKYRLMDIDTPEIAPRKD